MISAVVLAAGTSSRLGRPKQLLELDGRPLLQHVLEAASKARVDEVVVVLGHDAQRIAAALDVPRAARIIVNPDYTSGQASSLRAALAAVDPAADAAVILLGDQPRVRAEMIDEVIGLFEARGAPIVRARYGDVPGHPVLVARSEWASFQAARGDVGARDVIAASPEKVVEVDLGAPLADVDTWEQYARLTKG